MNIFEALYRSFYDPFAYEIVANRWRFKIVLYYLLLSLIFSISIYRSGMAMMDYLYPKTDVEMEEFLSGVEIKDGKIVCDFKEPRYLLNSDGSMKVAAISPRRLTPDESKGLIFSLADDLKEIHVSGFESVLKLGDDDLLMFDKNLLAKAFVLASFFSAMLMNALYIFIMTFACFMMSLTSFPGLKLSGSIKLTTLAITPAILISFATSMLLERPLDNFLLALITCGVIIYVFKKAASLGFNRNFEAPAENDIEI